MLPYEPPLHRSVERELYGPMTPMVGVVGGLGPRASAAFVSRLYEQAAAASEQSMPRLLLWSDPTFPDRTTELTAGNTEVLTQRLTVSARGLIDLGATEILVCCFTLHATFDLLPPPVADTIASLIDLTFEALEQVEAPALMLCSTGSRRLGVFDHHPGWRRIQHLVLWPSTQEQECVHDMIYRLKVGADLEEVADEVEELLSHHGVTHFIAGCTEFHLLSSTFCDRGATAVDALQLAQARILAGLPLRRPYRVRAGAAMDRRRLQT